jgi:hypothetical protein
MLAKLHHGGDAIVKAIQQKEKSTGKNEPHAQADHQGADEARFDGDGWSGPFQQLGGLIIWHLHAGGNPPGRLAGGRVSLRGRRINMPAAAAMVLTSVAPVACATSQKRVAEKRGSRISVAPAAIAPESE